MTTTGLLQPDSWRQRGRAVLLTSLAIAGFAAVGAGVALAGPGRRLRFGCRQCSHASARRRQIRFVLARHGRARRH